MIKIFALDKTSNKLENVTLKSLKTLPVSWFWVDIANADDSEKALLTTYFKFHHLAVEDCIHSLNKPKVDYYQDYSFFILNALHKEDLSPKEVSLFVGDNFVLSYHDEPSEEIDEAWNRVISNSSHWDKGPMFVTHQILDEIVDQFFPAAYDIEDKLDRLDNNIDNKSVKKLINEVFEIRGDLLKLRRLVNSMRDLLYRILNSEKLSTFQDHKLYFSDIYDHLLKLSDMVESSRDMTSDMRDSYLSVNSNRMNTNMMVLTVITTIFIPLTFIAGIYGMNFKYMPELEWKYGYFIVLIVMAIIGFLMYLWFKKKGWFDE